MSDLGYVDIRPILARLADLNRDLVLVGGQAVNFWAFVYEGRVPALAAALADAGDIAGARALHEAIGRLLGDERAICADVIDLNEKRRP